MDLIRLKTKVFHAHHCIVFVLISENMCALECHKVSCSVWEAMDKEGNNFCVNLALASLPPSTSSRGHILFLTSSYMFLMLFGSQYPNVKFICPLVPPLNKNRYLSSPGVDGWLMKKVQ